MQITNEGKERPTVVVIIPFYNGADWVERAIKSVVAQTVKPDEFIVVNDGSKPEEREALGKLADTYKFEIIDKPNGGQGSARNAGVKASKSEFISLLDQDDYYFPDHIRDLVDALPINDSRLGFVYADLCAADGRGNILHSNMLRDVPGTTHPKQGHIPNLLRFDLFILPSAALIERTAFEAVGGFDEQFTGYEDDDLFLRIFRAGYTNYFLDKPVTAWCQHQGSTSWSIKCRAAAGSTSRSSYRPFLTTRSRTSISSGNVSCRASRITLSRMLPRQSRQVHRPGGTAGDPRRVHKNGLGQSRYRQTIQEEAQASDVDSFIVPARTASCSAKVTRLRLVRKLIA